MNKPTWTKVVRITHWLVAAGVVFNLLNETGYTHRMIGYVCLFLIVLRIHHGVSQKAPDNSRLYLPRLRQVKQHISAVLSGQVMQHRGHNPLGMLAVYCIWGAIALLAFTGWLSRTDAYWGEDGPVLVHTALSNLLLGLIVIHVLAVLLMSRLERRNLIKAMLVSEE